MDHQCRKGHRVFLLALTDGARLFTSPLGIGVLLHATKQPNAQCDNMQQTGLDARSSCVTPPKIHSPNRLCP